MNDSEKNEDGPNETVATIGCILLAILLLGPAVIGAVLISIGEAYVEQTFPAESEAQSGE